MNKAFSILLLVLLGLCFSCRKDHHHVEKIILDTDMGSDCDDVGAMALLHSYAKEGKAEILGIIYSSGKVPYGVGVIDAINRYYGRPDIPVGACQSNCIGDAKDKMNAVKLANDTAVFHNKIIAAGEAIEQTKLNRRILAEQENASVTYITIGHTQGLYELLVSPPDEASPLPGIDLIQKKVKQWVALGALGASNEEGYYSKDWNFFWNGTAPFTAYLVEHFPGDMYFINAGANVFSGASLEQTVQGNIVRQAYEEWLWNVEKKSLKDQRPSWDLAAVYFAVEGLGDYLEYGEDGHLEFSSEKGSRWVTGLNSENRMHHYINQREGIEKEFGDYFNTRIVK